MPPDNALIYTIQHPNPNTPEIRYWVWTPNTTNNPDLPTHTIKQIQKEAAMAIFYALTRHKGW